MITRINLRQADLFRKSLLGQNHLDFIHGDQTSFSQRSTKLLILRSYSLFREKISVIIANKHILNVLDYIN